MNIEQEMPKCTMKELNLSHNNISKFFLASFLNNPSSYLNIKLEDNPLESIDFSAVEEKLNSSHLTLNIDIGESFIKCNCHTLSLYEFMNKKSFRNKSNYERIQIIPDDIRCQPTEVEDKSILLKNIDTSRMICSLDNKHQSLCPSSCACQITSDEHTVSL